MLVTFENLKKKYLEKIESADKIDNNMKHCIVAQNVRKIDYLEKLLNVIKSNQFFEFHYYSEEFFNAGKFLAMQRVKYEIELLYAYNNKILQNNWVVNYDNYITDHILDTLDKIINK